MAQVFERTRSKEEGKMEEDCSRQVDNKLIEPGLESWGRVQRKRVDWEGLVETVFAEEVGDFILQAQGKK